MSTPAGLPLEPAGTREELLLMLEEAGYGKLDWWLDSRTGLLSGLVPSQAIVNPATAARARLAVRRFLARLPEPIPDLVTVVAARLVEPDGYTVELDFEWDDGAQTRRLDLRPYLWGPIFARLREDQTEFAKFYVDAGTLCWPGGADLAPELLFGESWAVKAEDG